ncbi:phosphate ABC transporter permease PstA [Martelella alba]|uniref:Phosphate transport system permease protein PstA n=1 Tax=Martelella alba TaxID=2590451 RepID=A0A506U6H4_9HYPH|nr:phosphate ABC transporter permease PstA [Martelella alba]TPW27507.1 phosphate ABC transporter permease PstA [Martelella alba]
MTNAVDIPVRTMDERQRKRRLKRRYAAERRFRLAGIAAILVGIFFLAALIFNVVERGAGAFRQTVVTLPITFASDLIDPAGQHVNDPERLSTLNYMPLVSQALDQVLGIAPDDRDASRQAMRLISLSARFTLRDMVVADPSLLGRTEPVALLASSALDTIRKGGTAVRPDEVVLKAYIGSLDQQGLLGSRFNTGLFVNGASSRPEAAGIGVAMAGSLSMMAIVLVLSLSIGVGAAIYLEEFAPRNRFTDLIEVNINNLAAVPSIVFGLLGLAVFIGLLGLPRSAALVGGLVLTLMTLPTIIIATRAALAAVPRSIREAALSVGASRVQVVFHHVLPLAMPGILTGTLLGLAQAFGETAPLLLVGMVAFVADYPSSLLDPATALPVQIYMWAGEGQEAFVERTAAAIIVLLMILVAVNLTAALLRRRFARRRQERR